MQESTTQERSADARGGPLSPGKAFVIALLLLAAALTGWMLSRPDPPTPPPTTNNEPTEPNYTLTNEEAIDRFQQLRMTVITAVRRRDRALLSTAFSANSETADRVASEIGRLQDDKVIDQSDVRIIDVDVLESSSNLVRLRETVILSPCFESHSGTDVTRGPTLIRQVGEWTLVSDGGEWQLEDGNLVRDRVLERRGDTCS